MKSIEDRTHPTLQSIHLVPYPTPHSRKPTPSQGDVLNLNPTLNQALTMECFLREGVNPGRESKP